MAGNNAIQILRSRAPTSPGTFNREESNAELLDGQLFWDRKTGWLFIGSIKADGTLEKLKDLKSIQVDYSNDCLTDEEVETIWSEAIGETL